MSAGQSCCLPCSGHAKPAIDATFDKLFPRFEDASSIFALPQESRQNSPTWPVRTIVSHLHARLPLIESDEASLFGSSPKWDGDCCGRLWIGVMPSGRKISAIISSQVGVAGAPVQSHQSLDCGSKPARYEREHSGRFRRSASERTGQFHHRM